MLIFVIAAAVPDQVANSPVLRVIESPLTAEFMMGAFVGMLWRRRCVPGALAVALLLWNRWLDSFNSLYSAHAVAGGEPIP